MTLGDDVLPANVGLWDQHTSLKWVQENIEFFGGNKNRVQSKFEAEMEMSLTFFQRWSFLAKVLEAPAYRIKWHHHITKGSSMEQLLRAVPLDLHLLTLTSILLIMPGTQISKLTNYLLSLFFISRTLAGELGCNAKGSSSEIRDCLQAVSCHWRQFLCFIIKIDLFSVERWIGACHEGEPLCKGRSFASALGSLQRRFLQESILARWSYSGVRGKFITVYYDVNLLRNLNLDRKIQPSPSHYWSK